MCDRVGDGRADYSAKHRRHGVDVQLVTDPDGRLLWISPALPGRASESPQEEIRTPGVAVPLAVNHKRNLHSQTLQVSS